MLICNTLQHTATHYSTLQHTATHHNTPQHRIQKITAYMLICNNHYIYKQKRGAWYGMSTQIPFKRALHTSQKSPRFNQKSPVSGNSKEPYIASKEHAHASIYGSSHTLTRMNPINRALQPIKGVIHACERLT